MIATGDDTNAFSSEIVGVFSSEKEALKQARACGPHTASTDRFVIDAPADWVRA